MTFLSEGASNVHLKLEEQHSENSFHNFLYIASICSRNLLYQYSRFIEPQPNLANEAENIKIQQNIILQYNRKKFKVMQFRRFPQTGLPFRFYHDLHHSGTHFIISSIQPHLQKYSTILVQQITGTLVERRKIAENIKIQQNLTLQYNRKNTGRCNIADFPYIFLLFLENKFLLCFMSNHEKTFNRHSCICRHKVHLYFTIFQ